MTNPVPVQRAVQTGTEGRFAWHRAQAEAYYDRYVKQQDKVEAYERGALARQGGQKRLQGWDLRQDQDYKDLCGDRNRYQDLAHFHATMALMYK